MPAPAERPTPAARSGWKLARRRARNTIVALVAPVVMRLWMLSLRLRWCGPGLDCPAIRGEGNCIYVLWHQRLLTLIYAFRAQGIRVLVSQHDDGEMIARVTKSFGFEPIRGSSTRGGMRALRELLELSDRGCSFAIVPDGPRGPCFEFKPGAVFLASRSGLPVVPLTVSFARAWVLGSWDRFRIPRPFTRALVQVGESTCIPPDLDSEGIATWTRELGARLSALTANTDERFEELYRTAAKHPRGRSRSPCPGRLDAPAP